MGLSCAKCGREYPKLPAAVKPPIYCGDCTNRVDRVEVKKNAECVYRGKKIGYLDCRCGGAPKVYFCSNLQEPCIEHNTSKPWASVKPLMNEGWQLTAQPMVCVTCPLRLEKLAEKQG